MARTEVVRDGDTVLRSTGPWTAAVQALLRHLEAVGFPASPRVIDADAGGRERLSYLEGEVVHPHPWPAAGIAALGGGLRDLHEATASFVPPPDAVWQPFLLRCPPTAADAVVGHGDLGPWNIVAKDGLPVGFIDWELAGPVGRLDEVAQVGWLNAQLHADLDPAAPLLPADERAARLVGFVDAYGLARHERSGLVARMLDHALRDTRIDGGLRLAKAPVRPSDPGWSVAWRQRSLDWLVDHRSLLESALGS